VASLRAQEQRADRPSGRHRHHGLAGLAARTEATNLADRVPSLSTAGSSGS